MSAATPTIENSFAPLSLFSDEGARAAYWEVQKMGLLKDAYIKPYIDTVVVRAHREYLATPGAKPCDLKSFCWPNLAVGIIEGQDYPSLAMFSEDRKTGLLIAKPGEDLHAFMLVANLAAVNNLNFERKPVARKLYMEAAKMLKDGSFDITMPSGRAPTWDMAAHSSVLQWIFSHKHIVKGEGLPGMIQSAIDAMKAESAAPKAQVSPTLVSTPKHCPSPDASRAAVAETFGAGLDAAYDRMIAAPSVASPVYKALVKSDAEPSGAAEAIASAAPAV